jgi:hypothetical protein
VPTDKNSFRHKKRDEITVERTRHASVNNRLF